MLNLRQIFENLKLKQVFLHFGYQITILIFDMTALRLYK